MSPPPMQSVDGLWMGVSSLYFPSKYTETQTQENVVPRTSRSGGQQSWEQMSLVKCIVCVGGGGGWSRSESTPESAGDGNHWGKLCGEGISKRYVTRRPFNRVSAAHEFWGKRIPPSSSERLSGAWTRSEGTRKRRVIPLQHPPPSHHVPLRHNQAQHHRNCGGGGAGDLWYPATGVMTVHGSGPPEWPHKQLSRCVLSVCHGGINPLRGDSVSGKNVAKTYWNLFCIAILFCVLVLWILDCRTFLNIRMEAKQKETLQGEMVKKRTRKEQLVMTSSTIIHLYVCILYTICV